MADNQLLSYAAAIKKLPFRLGVPSFVYKASYAENVQRLSAVFDDIQLLVTEPWAKSPIAELEIKQLASFAGKVRFTVHLPAPSGIGVAEAEPDLLSIYEALKPLDVAFWVLHADEDAGWHGELAASRLRQFINKTGVPAKNICLENIETGFEKGWKAFEKLGISICVDVGHILAAGGQPLDFIKQYGKYIRMAHLHGVGKRDHEPLSCIEQSQLLDILKSLIGLNFDGAMIIENYNVADLESSIKAILDVLADGMAMDEEKL